MPQLRQLPSTLRLRKDIRTPFIHNRTRWHPFTVNTEAQMRTGREWLIRPLIFRQSHNFPLGRRDIEWNKRLLTYKQGHHFLLCRRDRCLNLTSGWRAAPPMDQSNGRETPPDRDSLLHWHKMWLNRITTFIQSRSFPQCRRDMEWIK